MITIRSENDVPTPKDDTLLDTYDTVISNAEVNLPTTVLSKVFHMERAQAFPYCLRAGMMKALQFSVSLIRLMSNQGGGDTESVGLIVAYE